MADNVAITPGIGENISAEEVTTLNGGAVSAVKVQRTAIAVVTANATAVDLPGDATNGLLVNLGTNNDVTVTGSVTANAGTNLNTSALALESGGNLAAAATSLATLDNAIAGNEMQVDVVGALPAGDNNIGNVDIASALPAGTNNIGDVDVLSIVPGTGATNLGKAEDGVHSSGDVGVMALAVRQNSQADFGADGDYVPLSVDDNGGVRVSVVAGGGTGGTSQTDDAAFTPASGSFTPVGGIVTSDSVDSGDGGAFAMLANRQQKVTLYDSSGVELAVGGGTQYDEDTAHSSGDKVTMAGVVRSDAGGALSGADGDRTVMQVDNSGRLRVAVSGSVTVSNEVDVNVLSIAAGDNNIGNVDVVTLPNVTLAATTNTIEVVGDAAHDAAAAGNPVLIAARANANEPTAVSADNDVTHLWADRFGRLVTLPGHPNPEAPVTVNATSSGNTTVIAAPGASLSLYICKASVHNRHADNVVVALQDGAGGTSRWRTELAGEGGGSLIDFGARGWKLTADTLLNVNLGGASDVDVNVTEYYIAP